MLYPVLQRKPEQRLRKFAQVKLQKRGDRIDVIRHGVQLEYLLVPLDLMLKLLNNCESTGYPIDSFTFKPSLIYLLDTDFYNLGYTISN